MWWGGRRRQGGRGCLGSDAPQLDVSLDCVQGASCTLAACTGLDFVGDTASCIFEYWSALPKRQRITEDSSRGRCHIRVCHCFQGLQEPACVMHIRLCGGQCIAYGLAHGGTCIGCHTCEGDFRQVAASPGTGCSLLVAR